MIENKGNKSEYAKFKKFADKKIIKFILTESTRGSSKASKYYEAAKIPLKTPKVIKRKIDKEDESKGSIEITYNYKIVVKERMGSPSSLPKYVLKQN